MRVAFVVQLVFAGILMIGLPNAQAEQPAVPQAIALDQSSAKLLQSHFSTAKLDVLVLNEDESFHSLDRRVLSMRDAKVLFYRSDQSTLTTQLLRERLSNQGVQGFDLDRQLFPKRLVPGQSNLEKPRTRLIATGLEKESRSIQLGSTAILAWLGALER